MNVPAVDGGLLKPDVVEGTDDEVEIKRTIPKGSVQSKDFKTKKIFVGGVPTICLEVDEFENFFSKHGKVVVDDLLANGNMIDMVGTCVEIEKVEPKKASNPPPATLLLGTLGHVLLDSVSRGRLGGYGGYSGGNELGGGYGGFGGGLSGRQSTASIELNGLREKEELAVRSSERGTEGGRRQEREQGRRGVAVMVSREPERREMKQYEDGEREREARLIEGGVMILAIRHVAEANTATWRAKYYVMPLGENFPAL
ncbi:hypothetical protein Syun_014249 [Stephania yunnanensis]|uniref:RNA-binding protein n=1 Tax=Stephania yunnanensis TaxID=152371 RepID=A0AAP0P9D0_9MAGN